MREIKGKSIAVKLSIVMAAIIIIQAILLVVSVMVSGVITGLQDTAYSALSEKVDNRKNYLQTEMNSRFSNIESFAHDIIAEYNLLNLENGWTNDKVTDKFLETVAPHMLTMLRSTMSTGSFLILDDNATPTSAHSGVYFKDSDPILNNEANKDINMLIGPVSVFQSLLIPLQNAWSYGITLNEQQRDIFEKPYASAEQNSKIKLFGYWHVSPDVTEGADPMLTYSIPLIGSNGTVFGVLGIDISQDYLYKILPSNELSSDAPLGYAIGKLSPSGESIIPVMSRGALQSSVLRIGEPLKISPANDTLDCYYMDNSDSFPIICNTKTIQLYNNNTPFEDEQWVLIGMVSRDSIVGFSHRFVRTLLFSFFGSIIVGVLVMCLSARSFVRPIVALAKKVRTNDPANLATIARTGLSEIDELSSAIMELNQNVFDVSQKTDKIIQMLNLPFGAFEHKKGTNFVSCSPNLSKILDLPVEHFGKNCIDSGIFFEKIDEVMARLESMETDVYMLCDNPAIWVQLVIVDNENSILGVVMDVTRQILDKHSIKFERDYDDLTKIYNRVAFKREANNIFNRGIGDVSAVVMFDLDNLKYINDVYGHDMGDEYITLAAQQLTRSMQKHSLVGRMSGDEFYVLLYNFDSKDAVWELMRKMYENFEQNQMLLPNGELFKLRMSGGLAWYGEHSTSLDELIKFADFAMYQGKHSVKGVVREFDRTVYNSDFFMFSGREELNKVLENQLIEFVFQPIVSAKTGRIYAFESLMRPQSELLATPSKLIQIAKAQSNLWLVEKLAFFKTLATYEKYSEMFKNCKIFINSVPNERLKDEEYRELERLYPDILKNVVVEIIESEKLDTETLAFKRELMDRWGGALALDDYGSGYNGDVTLLRIQPQVVKIDKLLIEDIENDRNRQSIVQKLVRYGKEQGVLILAEGVETKSQMEKIVSMGVDLMQGFYIAYPSFVPDFDDSSIAAEIVALQGNTSEETQCLC